MKKTIDGIIYMTVPEHNPSSCNGCVGLEENSLCQALNDSCARDKTIWFKATSDDSDDSVDIDTFVEYALEYFLESDDDGYHVTGMAFKAFIQDKINKKNRESDPEYIQYLELKNKFEGE